MEHKDAHTVCGIVRNIARKGEEMKILTLQELESTEVDMFSGVLLRLGKQLEIPTPYNALALDIIKALEEKNDGRFDYQ